MNKLRVRVKAGAYYAPALLILFYFLLVSLDLYTTFLASPDLKYEGNIIIKLLNLRWSKIIFFTFIIILLISVGYLYSVYFLKINFKKHQKNIKKLSFFFKNKKIVLSVIMMSIFYSHFTYTIFLIINNYLSYIYLYSIENAFSEIAKKYINNIILGRIYFYYYALLFFIMIGCLISITSVHKIWRSNIKVVDYN